MTWTVTTQSRVLAAIERGITQPKEIAKAAGIPRYQINTYLARLDTKKLIRREHGKCVPYRNGLALVDAWK